jgi:hypothetical protein
VTKPNPFKGLSPEEWNTAAVRSLTDEALKLMTQTVATLFKTLKDEAVRRGIWEELKGEVKP